MNGVESELLAQDLLNACVIHQLKEKSVLLLASCLHDGSLFSYEVF
jgi:hypothetical protein